MSRPESSGNSPPKRRRTVEGSCWPCKQRRVKCDLQKPSCHRCIISRTEDCSYDKLLLRWKKRPAKTVPLEFQSQPGVDRSLCGIPLPVNERKALDYFKARLWPLLSTVNEPCPPPLALAFRSQPVLQALCVFAEEHRALQESTTSNQNIERRRLHCLSTIRDQLGGKHSERASLSALLVAVLLLYFSEGYVKCTNADASTLCHLAGALAIIDALGGFESAWSTSDRITRMLLSELASTDLTDALLQDRRPSFPITIWEHMEESSVWWDTVPGTKSLTSVFCTLAEMSFYRHGQQNGAEACVEKVKSFERALEPTYPMMDYTTGSYSGDAGKELFDPGVTASLSLVRAFQHAGLIYLYSAIYNMPTKHVLVQQHVHACLECIRSMGARSKAQNCSLFPLYVAGAHSIVDEHRMYVLEALEIIHNNLRFESVPSIRKNLEMLWLPSRNPTTWTENFKDAAVCTLVI
ncbi:Fungal-trans-2 multi-domain protein [Pyrenophora tritici-repentis]|uniref:Fungal specific transcription factor domain containing protein n=1 Tax=Pyrenophora tritici-repentis TaxID=45151 RepID=A0A2W1G8U5_9PLEO|nr:Fungal-trans-2 multi-domain protein [Pyrenophora tritici-repentis]KAF7575351.1 Fungal-trans-2 multi-domain protein [Pyrenophora tritici-repentis]KAG9385899.1 Fungal-trans-2 multi-domain protein [Pyrenophora tritici-repentis]KAI1514907.1 Fungal specific transcription factor domain containing protein [Pyrenophora tritici-repentis]KAI1672913.1 Fungal specific transcription factor domain containing protein [Pyrenophora tritici-repentis]